jgi:pyruvate carboxylase
MMQGHERELPVDLDSLNRFSNYWEVIREYYYPFESELKAGTAEVYAHEIPGGQYSNLRPQARGLGLEAQFEQIKENYAKVNQMFGDIVKVTPSSKVVGDMALFMTSNKLSAEEVMARGGELAFPDSVISFFRGDLGQPHGGFPGELQKLVLKGEIPFTDRPNAHLAPVDFDREFAEFHQKFDKEKSFLDFLSWKLYPKVYEDFDVHFQEYADVSRLPTSVFFYPMEPNEEILINLDEGKSLLIRYMYMTEANDEAIRSVFFKINGQTRSVEVRDLSVTSEKVANRKVDPDAQNEIGSPLQGKLSKVFVKAGDKVERNQPLFVIEAMKMESSITATKEGTVRRIHLASGVMVAQDDLVVEME